MFFLSPVIIIFSSLSFLFSLLFLTLLSHLSCSSLSFLSSNSSSHCYHALPFPSYFLILPPTFIILSPSLPFFLFFLSLLSCSVFSLLLFSFYFFFPSILDVPLTFIIFSPSLLFFLFLLSHCYQALPLPSLRQFPCQAMKEE